jgi:hypothetical protein
MEMNSAGQQLTDTGTPGVMARPPILFLAALMLGFVLDHLLRLPFPVARIGSFHWISAIIAGSLILTGIAVFSAGIRNFSSAATPVQGTKPTRTLVTTGIHGWRQTKRAMTMAPPAGLCPTYRRARPYNKSLKYANAQGS